MKATRYTPHDLNLLATQPGVYRFYNREDALIYVGKAKNIKKRVSSYFTNSKQHNLKTRKMVEEVVSIEFTIVNSEYEALLLENNLIKRSQPRYNILLKDGKTFPYICITNERFPRVVSTRKVAPHLGKFYGPFTDLKAMNSILGLIKQLYAVRTCTHSLTEENISKGKFKVCLEYHLGNCKGPCEGFQVEGAYQRDIDEIAHLLKGNLAAVKKAFVERMHEAARVMNYEEAQSCKERLDALSVYQAKSLVVNPSVGDLDVFGIVSDEEAAFVSYLRIKGGAIIFTQTVELKKKLGEDDDDILPLAILSFRERCHSQAPEVLSNVPLVTDLANVLLVTPKIGDKKKLVDIAVKNALFFKQDRFVRKVNSQPRENRVLSMLQHDLQLKELPVHIECFDNSNIQGTNPVAAMVCFKNGKPAKRDYRHFHIKTVVGPNDFASMREVVYRRYKRLVEEQEALPNLVLIDGGKGQLSAAIDALKEVGIYGQMAVIGIAKRLEELYYPDDPYPVYVSKKSASLKLLQQLRNEAHRFAIAFHRNIRSKAGFKSSLDGIPGIGPKTIDKLLRHFKSVKNVREADFKSLSEQIGDQKASILKNHFY